MGSIWRVVDPPENVWSDDPLRTTPPAPSSAPRGVERETSDKVVSREPQSPSHPESSPRSILSCPREAVADAVVGETHLSHPAAMESRLSIAPEYPVHDLYGRATPVFLSSSGQELGGHQGTPAEEAVGASVSVDVVDSPSTHSRPLQYERPRLYSYYGRLIRQ